MGHHVEIFTSPPPESCICAVCHDVLKDAVGINCGHSFCEECAKVCLPTKACPNCRADFTSYAPNFTTREWIGSMPVKCIHGHDEQDEEARKRARGNDGEVVVAASNSGCTWSGKCQDLQTHENTCQFKIVTCSIDGCNHECPRRDMAAHLSGGGLVLHMNLMKQSITASYENKIQDMKHQMEISWECEKRQSSAQIKSLEKKIKVLETKVRSLNNTSDNIASDNEVGQKQQVSVDGCGISEINGIYQQDDRTYDEVPCYSKPGRYEGNEVVFTIYRCDFSAPFRVRKRWYISILPLDGECGYDIS